jgi:hypothetical protein
LCLYDDVEVGERGAQSLRGADRSRLEAVCHSPAGDQRNRCRQCQTKLSHRFLLEPELTKWQDTRRFQSDLDADQIVSGTGHLSCFDSQKIARLRVPTVLTTPDQGDNAMSLGTILIIILVIALLGGFSGIGGGPFYGTGYYGGGGLGLIIVILLILVLLGKL